MSSFIAFRTAALSVLRPRAHHTPCLHLLQTRGARQDASRKPPRDEEIEHRMVQLVDPETGRLMDPMPLSTLLASLDRRKQFVELVSLKPAPLVKIFSKAEVTQREHEAESKARAAARRVAQKEIQMTWSAAPGDLEHKLGKVRQELEVGARVDLVFTRKKNQAPLKMDEMKERAQEVVDSLADISKEWKEREVHQNMTAIFLQGTGEPPAPLTEKRPVVHKGPKVKSGPNVNMKREKSEKALKMEERQKKREDFRKKKEEEAKLMSPGAERADVVDIYQD
ncbi:hypothetical protein H0H81_006405 [Sphagnurus paluster]|uniref:Translation initiation factor 3 N-terminal domain-containing protein n=1 Tax=Sphagnurus paluster TaxID=117069 RepID=A0A9P7K5K9_9AGAR|nr:hypothetical protein H0H81_006405 [Sphagnurus paluster]